MNQKLPIAIYKKKNQINRVLSLGELQFNKNLPEITTILSGMSTEFNI